MKTTKIHLVYGVVLSICMGSILHLKYCREAVMNHYDTVSGTALQVIKNQDQQMLIAAARFVNENRSLQNTVYLNKLWETDSLLQVAFGDLETLPVADLPGYRDIFTGRLATLYQSNEESLKIIHNLSSVKEGFVFGGQEIREMLQLEYRLLVSELYQLCLSKITRDCWFGSWGIPFLLPVQKQVYKNDWVHLGVIHGYWIRNYYTIKIGGTARNLRDGVFTLDTVFQHDGTYLFYVELQVGGEGRSPIELYYDTVYLQIFPK